MAMVNGINDVPGTTYNNLQNAVRDAETGLQTANNHAAKVVSDLNAKNWKDANGNTLKFDNMADWQRALETRNLKDAHGRPITGNAGLINTQLTNIAQAVGRIDTAQKKLAAANEAMAPMKAMVELLKSGDIQGAIMLLQTTRVKNLDEQLKGRIAALQDRNAQIKSLNDQLGDAQKALAGDKDNGDKQKRVTQLKGQIDLMNSDSQLDMIGLQSLVNKRNEAFDMLSNLLNKFQKTMDGIVGNMR
jgi:small-conductance mechanosensitive channel